MSSLLVVAKPHLFSMQDVFNSLLSLFALTLYDKAFLILVLSVFSICLPKAQIPFSGTHIIKWPLLLLKDELRHIKMFLFKQKLI